jgi:hypothetical protein
MPAYIIIDAYSGYIWGDTRNFDGKTYNAESITDACAALDRTLGEFGRTYAQVPQLSGMTGYVVYRVDIDGSEAVPVVRDGQDQDTIDAVERDCDLIGYVEVTSNDPL